MKTMYRDVAETLFDLQGDTIQNSLEFYFDFSGWSDKYGAKAKDLFNKVTIPYENIEQLSQLIKSDHEHGLWGYKNGELYHYTMLDEYGGYIDNCIEKQLALLSGVGYQMQIVEA